MAPVGFGGPSRAPAGHRHRARQGRRARSTSVPPAGTRSSHAGRRASVPARGEWNSWRTSGRLVYLHGPEYAGANDAWRVFPDDPDDHIILAAPALTRDGGAEAVQAARTLKAIVFGVRANAQARRQFAPRYLTQALRNRRPWCGTDVRTLRDTYRAGRPWTPPRGGRSTRPSRRCGTSRAARPVRRTLAAAAADGGPRASCGRGPIPAPSSDTFLPA